MRTESDNESIDFRPNLIRLSSGQCATCIGGFKVVNALQTPLGLPLVVYQSAKLSLSKKLKFRYEAEPNFLISFLIERQCFENGKHYNAFGRNRKNGEFKK